MEYDTNFWLFLALLLVVAFALCSQIICLNRLKVEHQETWEKLGKPTIFFQEVRSYPSLFSFFYAGKFVKLGDGFLSFFGALKILFDVLGVGLFVFLFFKNYSG